MMLSTKRRRRAPRLVTFLLLLGLLSGPVLYPVWLLAVTRRRKARHPQPPKRWPDLLVVVPAYKEQAVIAAKLDDLRENGYPGRLRLLVVAEDKATAEAAMRKADVVQPPERLGKARALNLGLADGSEPIVVITDADTRLVSGALAKLVAWFQDPDVDAVAGEKQVLGGGQGAYWHFESWLKQRESVLGTTIGVVGELAAFRRSALRPLPGDVVVDDLWLGLDVIEGGGRVTYEPAATAVEPASPTLAIEWERRTRIQAGLLDLLRRRRRLLMPGRSPVAPELWGHKALRAVAGPLAHAVLLAEAITALRRSRLAAAFLAAHLLAALALLREARGRAVSRLERLAGQLAFMQATALAGIVRYMQGDRPVRWPKPDRHRSSLSNFDPGAPEDSASSSDHR
jgi:biofilm PGA synthesis N-glycosyltransferase PgaC